MMELILAKDQRKYEDIITATPHAEFLQSWEWGDFQRSLGKKVWRWQTATGDQAGQACLQSLPGGFSYIYWPRALIHQTSDFFKTSVVWLSEQAAADKPIFLRVEPQARSSEAPSLKIVQSESMQPADTTLVDLNQSEEDLLRAMKPKTRYNIRLAEKKGVRVVEDTSPTAQENFCHLFSTTQQRHQLSGHDIASVKKIMTIFPSKLPNSDSVRWLLLSALFEQTVLASALLIHYGDTVTYLYGASSGQMQNLMAPYLLHWTAIRQAKKSGYASYDFFGIAPEENDNKPAAAKRRHKWAGITRFKLGFGGTKIHYPGAYDIILRPTWYRLYKIFQRVKNRNRK